MPDTSSLLIEIRTVSVGVFEGFWKKVKTCKHQFRVFLALERVKDKLTSFITLSNLRYIG